jgi:hypothetical protein
MSNTRNGHDQTYRDPARRIRVDDMAAIVARHSPGPSDNARVAMLESTHSGRRFVLVAGTIVLLIWGTLYVVFRQWRAKYRDRAQYGATQVVPVIDPLSGVMPPGVTVAMWRDAVDQTRAMLTTVTGSNLLDKPEMVELKVELAQHVRQGCRRPAMAVGELAEIWNDVTERGEFLFRDSRSLSGDRHPRPRILPTYGATRVAPAINPLRALAPLGVDRAQWRDAVDQTRALLLAVTDSNMVGVKEMQKLRTDVETHVGRANEHPETGLRELAEIWKEVAARADLLSTDRRLRAGGQYPRPEILPPLSAATHDVKSSMPVR